MAHCRVMSTNYMTSGKVCEVSATVAETHTMKSCDDSFPDIITRICPLCDSWTWEAVVCCNGVSRETPKEVRR
jgi:hypothetical protein